MKPKRILSALLCCVMLFALLPTAALAVDSPVTIAGTTLEIDKYYKFTVTGTASDGTATDYNARYDSSTGSLKLNGLTLTDYANGPCIYISDNQYIDVTGVNTVSTAAASNASAITTAGYTLGVKGSGSLSATAHGTGHGISAGGVIVVGGGTLTAIAAGSGSGNGIDSTDSVIVGDTGEGSGNLTAKALGTGKGVNAMNDIILQYGSTLEASGGGSAMSKALICSDFDSADKWEEYRVLRGNNADGSGATTVLAPATPATSYTLALTAGHKYLKIGKNIDTSRQLALTFTDTTITTPPDENTDYTYINGVLTIIKAGAYTLSMANTGTTTTHRAVVNESGVTLTLNNLTIETAAGPAVSVGPETATSTLSGVKILLSGTNRLTSTNTLPNGYAALQGNGAFTVDSAASTTASPHSTAGTLVATGSGTSAGVGSYFGRSLNLTIDGGTIVAKGGHDGTEYTGPGIGNRTQGPTDFGERISVTVSGGDVTAEGFGGIGATRIGTISITGGTVSATGCKSCGIGTLANANVSFSGGSISISGGTVTAAGGNGGAGIGGFGAGGTGPTQNISITISGGTVTANGGTYLYNSKSYGAPGIGASLTIDAGGSTNTNGAIVTIRGGTVNATGGYGAAGIGGSSRGDATGNHGWVTISGGSVTAAGGTGAQAIGNGESSTSTEGYVRVTPAASTALLTRVANAAQTNWSGVAVHETTTTGTYDYKADTTAYNSQYAHIATGYAVTGTVKDGTGAGVEGATVTAGGQTATTDATGAYTLYLENGTYTLAASKDGLRGSVSVTVNGAAAAGNDMNMTLPTVVNIPKTGDSALPGLWAGLVLLAGAGLLVLKKRRRA